MGAFDAINIAVSGVNVAQTWLDVIANNIANVNTVRSGDEEPFRSKLVYAEEIVGAGGVGEGVKAAALLETQGDPIRVYDPSNPLADEDGYVNRPSVDLAVQMSDLIIAQRTYQLNIQVIQTSEETYQSALQIGQ